MRNRTMIAVWAAIAVLIAVDLMATSYISRDYYIVGGEDCEYEINERSISSDITLGMGGLINGDNCEGKLGGMPYVLEDDLVIEPTGVLRLQPGVTLKFKDELSTLTVYGTLIAEGVLFTTYNVPPFPSDWSGVRFSGENAAHSRLADCSFEYGGASDEEILGMVQCEDGADISIVNCTFSYSGLYGVLTDGASPRIEGCTFIGCERFPIYQRSLDDFPDYFDNRFTDNAFQGVLLASGRIERSGTWQNPGIPYAVSVFGGSGQVEIGQDATLTLEPGAIVKFIEPEGRLDVNGGLVCNGTPTQPVVFTSFADDWSGGDTNGDGGETWPEPGQYTGLRFLSGSSGRSFLSCTIMSYGGQGRDGTAAVHLSLGANVLFNTCLFAHSSQIGIKVVGAAPSLLGCFIMNNQTGVHCKDNAQPILDRCNFIGNGDYAVFNESSRVVQARDCFWGDGTGPYDPDDDTAEGGFYNPGGLGDAVSNRVDYGSYLYDRAMGPTFSIRTNEPTYSEGETFRALVSYANISGETYLDAYIAIMLPDGALVFWPTYGLDPFAFPLQLAGLSGLPECELFSVPVPGGLPAGDYGAFAAGFWPGTFDFVTNLAHSQFEID